MLATPIAVVKQRFEQDCYLACFCMALGITYEEMVQRIGSEFAARIGDKGIKGGDDLQALTASLGLVEGQHFMGIDRLPPKVHPEWGCGVGAIKQLLWGRRALLQVKSINLKGRFHIVYWDGFELHDPSNKEQVNWDAAEPLFMMLFNEAGPAKAPLEREDADDAS